MFHLCLGHCRSSFLMSKVFGCLGIVDDDHRKLRVDLGGWWGYMGVTLVGFAIVVGQLPPLSQYHASPVVLTRVEWVARE